MQMHEQLKQLDTKELELAETVFIQNIETSVFQSIAVRCLLQIQGIALLEGNLIDNWLGRDSSEGIKGIHVDQDERSQSVNVKVEVNVSYGICIPKKGEEMQVKIAQDISRLTGLHVSSVHVIFKNLIPMSEDTN
jgi:uncharacterized alkaline shock family protein YloU